jgi:hypothetical protein
MDLTEGVPHHTAMTLVAVAVDGYRAGLRAKVEALWLTQIVPPNRDTYVAAIKDVLALLEGRSDVTQ